MLYIIDNGERYSDRKIYFVKDPGYTREQVEALLKLLSPPDLIDVTEDLEPNAQGRLEERWFEGKLLTFPELMADLDYRLTSWDDEHRATGQKIASDLPEDLRNYLSRFLREGA